jgi:predicted O-methyltransferase YrrM
MIRHTKPLSRFKLALVMLLLPLISNCQNNSSFKGLNDKQMINVLKNFPEKANRWNVPSEDGRLLYDLIIENNYKKVVEVGTSNGYSALWMGFALQKTGGKLITIEINEERALEARENIKNAGLENTIEVRINDAIDEIPNISGNVDFVFLDADKSQYISYYVSLKNKLNPGGAFAAHNVLTMDYAMRDFIKAVNKNPNYSTKTYKASSQGILVAYKKK